MSPWPPSQLRGGALHAQEQSGAGVVHAPRGLGSSATGVDADAPQRSAGLALLHAQRRRLRRGEEGHVQGVCETPCPSALMHSSLSLTAAAALLCNSTLARCARVGNHQRAKFPRASCCPTMQRTGDQRAAALSYLGRSRSRMSRTSPACALQGGSRARYWIWPAAWWRLASRPTRSMPRSTRRPSHATPTRARSTTTASRSRAARPSTRCAAHAGHTTCSLLST